jgi:hypothetical protein
MGLQVEYRECTCCQEQFQHIASIGSCDVGRSSREPSEEECDRYLELLGGRCKQQQICSHETRLVEVSLKRNPCTRGVSL